MSAVFSIREACRADLPAILALLSDDPLGKYDEQTAEPLDEAYELAFAAIERDPHQRLVVGAHGDAVVACLQITLIPGLARRGAIAGQIEGVRVASGLRGAGIGRTMLHWAMAWCQARGCVTIQLTTDKRRAGAQRFYGPLGCVASHEGMKRSLTASDAAFPPGASRSSSRWRRE